MYQLLISDESRLDILDAFSWYESHRIEDKIIRVMGVFHTGRNPANWIYRLKP